MSLLDKFKKPFEREKQSAPDHAVVDPATSSGQASKKAAKTAKTTKKDDKKSDTAKKPAAKKDPSAGSGQAKKVDIKDPSGRASQVIVRPLQTEKNSELMVLNKYVFEVAPRATKSEVKKAFKALYNVDPINVNIMNRRGKEVRFGRVRAQQKDWRRAIVTLKQGDRIEVFEGV